LPFERFLNPMRPSAPDIDMDFADNRRDEMISYARQKYGNGNVAQIGTFGTMAARGAVRDVARALGHPYALGDRIAKLIPMGSQGFPMTIEHALSITPELKTAYESEDEVQEVIDMAKKIEGLARHISVHAAGVVISPVPLNDIVPVQFDPKGEGKIITQYDMHYVDENSAGLLKFDFLGLRNLAILSDAIRLTEIIAGVKVDIEKIPIDDKKTFEMLARGETMAIFQLAGSGMTKHLIDLKPSTIHDINAMVALYRPGPMEMIPEYVKRKHKPSLIKLLDPRMKDILDFSYGVITYQDDVMLIAINLAGYSWLEADALRKAMGKKIPAVMAAEKDKLIAGLIDHGMSAEKANELWGLIEPFAAYGFNKCLTGDTRIVDAETGNIRTMEELYRSQKDAGEISVQSLDASFKLQPRGVSAVMENGVKEVFEIKTKTNKSVKATANHPFLTQSGWKQISELKTGLQIAVKKDTSDILWDEIISITPAGKEMTYDLTVEPDHNFVANDIIVHNSHAASYGRLAYQTAYMKANFPAIYMAAALTAETGNIETIAEYISECKRMGIPVLPPDVNESFKDFTVVKTKEESDAIRFGLYTIKNFGENIAEVLIKEREENGKFVSLEDFLSRIKDRNLNKKSVEALIKTGALDQFEDRGIMLANLDELLAYNKESVAHANTGHDSLFGGLEGAAELPKLKLEHKIPAKPEEKLLWEKELLGLYISGHPLDKHKDKFDKQDMSIKKALEEIAPGKEVIVGGLVEEAREVITKKNTRMMFLKLADRTASIEVVAFPKIYEQFRSVFVLDNCIAVKGKISERNGALSIMADKAKMIE
jgi:DNA polymerase III alpha subunit